MKLLDEGLLDELRDWIEEHEPIDVLAKSTIGTQTFMMPAMGEEVWCAMDAKGEDGSIIGSKYNSQNPLPHSSNDDIGLVWADGFVHINTGSALDF